MCTKLERRSFALATLLPLLLLPTLAAAKPPEGWIAAGAAPRDYEMGTDKAVSLNGKASAFLRAAKPTPAGFGTLMQIFRAEDFRGKRVRLSAQVQSRDVVEWAGLWMRVDGKGDRPKAFDNMQRRPIRGTTPFTEYQVVLDVAADAEAIAFGILLDGAGALWMNAVRFEIVDKNVPVTGGPHSDLNEKPKNLDFAE